MRQMHWIFAASLGGLLAIMGCMDKQATPTAESKQKLEIETQAAGRVDRGKYLVSIMACNDCHTPFKLMPTGPAPDMEKMLAGHPAGFKITALPKQDPVWIWSGTGTNTAFAGPWGVSFAANLTPDKVSGLGSVWDEARFIKAMRTGRHFGEARPILPPMPWQGLSQATDDDLKSIWAYLQSIPPVRNEVPAAIPPTGAGSLN
jgi:hypothetical protein